MTPAQLAAAVAAGCVETRSAVDQGSEATLLYDAVEENSVASSMHEVSGIHQTKNNLSL